MADKLSFQLLAFNFASRTYACKCLAQGLGKSVTGLSAFIGHYLDPCLAAVLCSQLMDDIGCAVDKFENLVPALRKIFDCLRRSGSNLSPGKCELETESTKFLGNTINPKGISAEAEKIEFFFQNSSAPNNRAS